MKLKAACSNCCATHYEGTVIPLSIYTCVPSVISRAKPSTRTSTSNKFTSNCHLKSNCHLQSYYETATVTFPGPYPKQWVCFQRWCSTSWWTIDLTLNDTEKRSISDSPVWTLNSFIKGFCQFCTADFVHCAQQLCKTNIYLFNNAAFPVGNVCCLNEG